MLSTNIHRLAKKGQSQSLTGLSFTFTHATGVLSELPSSHRITIGDKVEFSFDSDPSIDLLDHNYLSYHSGQGNLVYLVQPYGVVQPEWISDEDYGGATALPQSFTIQDGAYEDQQIIITGALPIPPYVLGAGFDSTNVPMGGQEGSIYAYLTIYTLSNAYTEFAGIPDLGSLGFTDADAVTPTWTPTTGATGEGGGMSIHNGGTNNIEGTVINVTSTTVTLGGIFGSSGSSITSLTSTKKHFIANGNIGLGTEDPSGAVDIPELISPVIYSDADANPLNIIKKGKAISLLAKDEVGWIGVDGEVGNNRLTFITQPTAIPSFPTPVPYETTKSNMPIRISNDKIVFSINAAKLHLAVMDLLTLDIDTSELAIVGAGTVLDEHYCFEVDYTAGVSKLVVIGRVSASKELWAAVVSVDADGVASVLTAWANTGIGASDLSNFSAFMGRQDETNASIVLAYRKDTGGTCHTRGLILTKATNALTLDAERQLLVFSGQSGEDETYTSSLQIFVNNTSNAAHGWGNDDLTLGSSSIGQVQQIVCSDIHPDEVRPFNLVSDSFHDKADDLMVPLSVRGGIMKPAMNDFPAMDIIIWGHSPKLDSSWYIRDSWTSNNGMGARRDKSFKYGSGMNKGSYMLSTAFGSIMYNRSHIITVQHGEDTGSEIHFAIVDLDDYSVNLQYITFTGAMANCASIAKIFQLEDNTFRVIADGYYADFKLMATPCMITETKSTGESVTVLLKGVLSTSATLTPGASYFYADSNMNVLYDYFDDPTSTHGITKKRQSLKVGVAKDANTLMVDFEKVDTSEF